MAVIYRIKNLINNFCYYGSAYSFPLRVYKHKNLLNKNKHCNLILQNAWNKYGEENFKFEIIEEALEKSNLLEREQFYLDFFNPEYNISKVAGGGNIYGEYLPLRVKNKISKTTSDGRRKGENHSQFGTKRSDKTKNKISNSLKGEKNYMFGKVGNKHPNYGKIPWNKGKFLAPSNSNG